jgi:AcrR family transcriptional regulator
MPNSKLDIQEVEKLFNLLLYFEGYVSDDGVNVDLSKVSKRSFTRTQIILQSVAIFSQKGITDTTVQDLLLASDVSRRTFYKYFKDKFDVLESIYQLSINMFSKRLFEKIDESNSMVDLVEKTVDAYFTYHTSMGSMIRIMHEEACRQESPLNARRKLDRETFVDVFINKSKSHRGILLNRMSYYTIFWSLENTSMYLLTETKCSDEELQESKEQLVTIIKSIINLA